MITVLRYGADKKRAWDGFVATAKNGLFMFGRDYMDYHADRFADHSLMLFRDGKLEALLPANELAEEKQIVSHGGLTFGGFVTSAGMKAAGMLACLDAATKHFRAEGFTSLTYKQIPHIYSAIPAEEDAYALFRAGAQLVKVEPTTAICLQHPARPNPRSNKAERLGIRVARSGEYAGFWALLSEVLRVRHDALPTHSLEEILALAGAFPENIRLYTACLDGEMLAGTVLYEYENIVHTQYLASSARGRETGAMNLLLATLIGRYAPEKHYFDFGISTENGGLLLNEGLIQQKERHGGRTVAHYTWRLTL